MLLSKAAYEEEKKQDEIRQQKEKERIEREKMQMMA